MINTNYLRYAIANECPQIFCFDGRYLLLLQFQAHQMADLGKRNTRVKSWLLHVPNDSNENTPPLREALCCFFTLGLRRIQGQQSPRLPPTLGRFTPAGRQWFSGKVTWRIAEDETTTEHPEGYYTDVDPVTGGVFWKDAEGQTVLDQSGRGVWDCYNVWGTSASH